MKDLLAALVLLAPGLSIAAGEIPLGAVPLGTRFASFLEQGPGSRAAGLAEASTAVADDASAAYWNPGGLARLASAAALVSHRQPLAGFGVSHVAGAVPAGPGTAGIAITLVRPGSYELRDESGAVTGTQTPVEFAGALAFAMEHPEWLDVPGGTGIAIEMARDSEGGQAVAGTIGSVIPVDRRLTLGWAARHLGPPQRGGTLPGVVEVGAGYTRPDRVGWLAEARYHVAGGGLSLVAGVEVTPFRCLALRAGYALPARLDGSPPLSGLAAGVGFRLAGLSLDYAIRPDEPFGATHQVSLSWTAGERRTVVPPTDASSPASGGP